MNSCPKKTLACFPHKCDLTSPSHLTHTPLCINCQIVELTPDTNWTMLQDFRDPRLLKCQTLVNQNLRELRDVQGQMRLLDAQCRKAARSGSVEYPLNLTKLRCWIYLDPAEASLTLVSQEYLHHQKLVSIMHMHLQSKYYPSAKPHAMLISGTQLPEPC